MRLSFILQTLFGLQGIAAVSVPLRARTVAVIEQDLATISTDLNNFDAALHAFVQGGGTLTQALAVHSDAAPSTTALSQALTDVKATTGISESDATAIELAISSVEDIVNDICLTFRNGVNSTTAANVRSLIQQDITAIVNAFDALLTAAEAATPSLVSSQIASIKNQVDTFCNLNGGPTGSCFVPPSQARKF